MPDLPEPIPPKLLTDRHPDWERMEGRWRYVRDHYDDQRLYDKLPEYLPQKFQAEHNSEYEERRKLAMYENFLGPVLDSLVGIQFAKQDEAEEAWGPLGNPADDQSLAAQVVRNVDGRGTDLEAQRKQLAVDLLLFQRVALLVDTNKRPDQEGQSVAEARQAGIRPFRKLIEPLALVNWREDENGRLVEALVREEVDERESLTDDTDKAESERYLWLLPDGWARLREGDQGIEVVDQGDYDYMDESGLRTVPLVVATIPIRRYLAYTLARINNALFNDDSSLRWQFRKASFQKFVFTGSQNQFEDYVEKSKGGGLAAVLESLGPEETGKGHRYVGPDMSGAEQALKLRDAVLRAFWDAAQFSFSDQAAERTATEIRADFAASIGAIEATLAGSLDEADNASLHLLAQAAGESVEQAREVSITRTRDFTIEDTLATAERLKATIFGEMGEVPAPASLKAAAVKKIAASIGLLDGDDGEQIEEDIDLSVQQAEDERRLQRDALLAGAAQAEPQPVGGALSDGGAGGT